MPVFFIFLFSPSCFIFACFESQKQLWGKLMQFLIIFESFFSHLGSSSPPRLQSQGFHNPLSCLSPKMRSARSRHLLFLKSDHQGFIPQGADGERVYPSRYVSEPERTSGAPQPASWIPRQWDLDSGSTRDDSRATSRGGVTPSPLAHPAPRPHRKAGVVPLPHPT